MSFWHAYTWKTKVAHQLTWKQNKIVHIMWHAKKKEKEKGCMSIDTQGKKCDPHECLIIMKTRPKIFSSNQSPSLDMNIHLTKSWFNKPRLSRNKSRTMALHIFFNLWEYSQENTFTLKPNRFKLIYPKFTHYLDMLMVTHNLLDLNILKCDLLINL